MSRFTIFTIAALAIAAVVCESKVKEASKAVAGHLWLTKGRFYFFFLLRQVMRDKIANEMIQEVVDGKNAEDLEKALVECE